MDEGHDRMTELGLGTAQLGLPYGISNRSGQPSEAAAAEILEQAVRAGVRTIDTAPAYGESEALIGRLLPSGTEVQVVTKTSTLTTAEVTKADRQALRDSAERSRERLQRDRLDALLVHHGSDLGLPGGERISEALIELRETGFADRIGVSIYDRAELELARRLLPLDIVQLPLNAFDQRFLRDGTLAELRDEGIEVHARSAFLQGLLLIAPDELPSHLEAAAAALCRFREWGRSRDLSPIEAALAAVRDQLGVDLILVGANSASELAECVAAMNAPPTPEAGITSLAVNNPALIDPRHWPA
jgi:aryl-alcohol dehydrogenase-like predicted oxidoreductase